MNSYCVTNLLEDILMKETLESYWYFHECTVSRAIHLVFWALFTFDYPVLSRAEKMKQNAGLTLPHFGNVYDNHIKESSCVTKGWFCMKLQV